MKILTKVRKNKYSKHYTCPNSYKIKMQKKIKSVELVLMK